MSDTNAEIHGSQESPIKQTTATAIKNLDKYLESPEEKILRDHQFDVVGGIRNSWARGETEGYITLPPSAGKTVIYSQLSRATGLRTLVLTPTLTTLDQGSKEFVARAPEINVTEYHSGNKDLSGDAVITTYQSALNLIQSGKLNPRDFDLLVADELHLGLGEIRHQLHRYFDHALRLGVTATPSFEQIEGYIKRGLVEKDEQWLNLFKNCIYEMGLEEAMERGISAQADIFLTRTNTKVENIEITSNGEYSKASVERELDKHARNMMTLAVIAGPPSIPDTISFSQEKLAELTELHEKIKNKRTAVFGLSIEHVNMLAEDLRKRGITAEAVHSQIDSDKRKDILAKHRAGEIQVVLGVDALRVGWDSPETKVGIYMAPTRSGVVSLQEFGRITRPYNDERATAIQFVDDFLYRGQAPVLFTNLFDPEYILRGSASGLERKSSDEKRPEKPIVTFSGLHIESTLEEVRSNDLLQTRFKRGTIEEMAKIIDRIVEETAAARVGTTSLEFFQNIQKALPARMPIEKQEEALQALTSLDSNTARNAKNILLYTNVGTIMSVLQPYLTSDPEKNEALFHAAMQGVLEKISTLKSGDYIKGLINHAAEEGIVDFLSDEYGIPSQWIRGKTPHGLIKRIRDLINPANVSIDYLTQTAEDLSEEFGLNKGQVFNYLTLYTSELTNSDFLNKDIENAGLDISLNESLQTIPPRESQVLYKKFVEGKTLEEIGNEINRSRERIRQIESVALRRLRKTDSINKLIDFTTSARTDKVFYPERPSYEEWSIEKGSDTLGRIFNRYISKQIGDRERNLINLVTAIKSFGNEVVPSLSQNVEGVQNYRWNTTHEDIYKVLTGEHVYFQNGDDRNVIEWHRRNKRGPYSYEKSEPSYRDTSKNENFYIDQIRDGRDRLEKNSIAHLNISPNTFLLLTTVSNNFSSISPELYLKTIPSLKHGLDNNLFSPEMSREIKDAILKFEELKARYD